MTAELIGAPIKIDAPINALAEADDDSEAADADWPGTGNSLVG